MCTVLLPPGDNTIAVNKYIIDNEYDNISDNLIKWRCRSTIVFSSKWTLIIVLDLEMSAD
jgi:hypothetical protein